MLKRLVLGALLGSILGFSATAEALYQVYRCSHDQLNPEQAKGRRKWAQSGANANPYDYKVNGSLSPDPRFWDPSYTPDAIEYSAMGIELYPVYMNPASWKAWKGPGPWAPFNASTQSQIMSVLFTSKPADISMDGVCEGGCYTPDQSVLFDVGFTPIGRAQQEGLTRVITLSPESTLDALSYIATDVSGYTVDKEEAEQTILVLQTESGGELKVTLEHPILSDDGSIRAARDFKVGDSLVHEDGSPDAITSITRQTWFGRAYNLRPKVTDIVSNIVIAQGYLNGSARFQNEYVEQLNRIILRKNVPERLIPSD